MKLGIATIQRNRAPWILEWLAFHYLVGFRKFYIFTHKCTDDTEFLVKKLSSFFDIKSFTVDENANGPQYVCYKYAYQNFCHEVDWMAFLDGDEFLFSPKSIEIQPILEEFFYRKISAIGVHWACFGSSGHIAEPQGLILENYRYRGPDDLYANRHIKSIIMGRQHDSIKIGNDPHLFRTPLGTYDEKMRLIESAITSNSATFENLRINHYMVQSRSFYLNFKKFGGTPMDVVGKPIIRPESWWNESDRNDLHDSSVEKFISPLKDLISSIGVL